MIEVRIRVFLKSDHGTDVVPSTTLMASAAPPALDVAKLAEGLIAELAPALGNVRRMSSEEADAYCAKEEAEEADGYLVVGEAGR